MGKDWATGLTKETDPRVARNAAAHIGRRYTSHLAPERDKRRRTSAGPVDTTWSPAVAYAVGLIATDGNLLPDRKSTNLVSGDVDLLEVFKRCVPRAELIAIDGAILTSQRKNHPNPMHELKYGKHASIALPTKMYADPASPRLDRQWRIWAAYLARPRINSLRKRRSGEIWPDAMDSRSIGP